MGSKLFSIVVKVSPQRHVKPFKDSLQSSYTPVTKNLDCKKPYNLANMTRTVQEQQRQAYLMTKYLHYVFSHQLYILVAPRSNYPNIAGHFNVFRLYVAKILQNTVCLKLYRK